MRPLLTMLFIFMSSLATAQPGFVIHAYNIDELPDDYALKNKENPHVYRLRIIIDSTSHDFSKLDILRHHRELEFIVRTKSFPEPFNTAEFDSLQKVVFNCDSLTSDLSNIGAFKKVRYMEIKNLMAEKLPDGLAEFRQLEGIRIENGPKLFNLAVLTRITALKSLDISACPNIEAFPKFTSASLLSEVRLWKLGQYVDLKNLKGLTRLHSIELPAPLDEVPGYFSKTLKSITVRGDVKAIAKVSKYPNLTHLSIISTSLDRFDADFKGRDMTHIWLSDNKKMTNIDGVYSCNLKHLGLSQLPMLTAFYFRDLTLESLTIEYCGIAKMEPITGIQKLKKLTLHDNDYLDVTVTRRYPDWDIYSNGRFVGKTGR